MSGNEGRAAGFNDRQFDELKILVRAEVAESNQRVLEKLEAIHDRLGDGDERMTELSTSIEVNNKSTEEMREAFDFAKRGLQVFGAIGNGIAWLIRKGWPLWGSIAALIAWWKGAPPTDHHH